MISPTPRSSRIHRVVLVGIVCLLATFSAVILVSADKYDNNPSPAASAPDATPLDAQAKTRIAEKFGKLPLSFEINKGQIDQRVKFVSHGPGYDLFLTGPEAVLSVQKPRALEVDKAKGPASANGATADANVREGTVLRLKMLGANAAPQVEGQEELPGKVHYFTGNDPAKWQRNVPTYRRVYFKEVYRGIDVVYYGNQRELEYDLIVAPGANPKLIRFTVEGADKVRLEKTGRLLLTLKHGEVSLNKPVIYQLSENGSRREVKGGYSLTGNEVRFKLETFDSSKPLVIDPVLSYSTMLGSGSNDHATGIAVDSQGNAYVTGTTDGTTFPTTTGAFKATSNRSGAFVTKLNPTGSSLIYSTYLSGNGTTNGFGIALDSAGNAHITGNTSASDFPIVNGLKTTSNFFKTTDAAVNWNNQNAGLVGDVGQIAVAPNAPNTIYASTSDGIYRSTDGGATWAKTPATGLTSFNFATAMAVDPTNSSVVYIGHFNGLFKTTDGSNTWTAVSGVPLNFASVFSIVFDPVTPSTMYLGAGNGVYKSTNSGATWITQNNFGVPGTPNVHALAIDPTAPLTIYAGTVGNGFFKSTNGGGVWTAMNNGMGGNSPTQINAIVIDPANPQTIYTGHTFSGGINKSTNGAASWAPLTNGVPQSQVNAMVATSTAVYAAFGSSGIIKTTNGGTSWTSANAGLWSTFVRTLVAHPTNAATLYAGTGTGFSLDAFVTKLNASGSGVLFSTLLGGSNEETGNGIAVDGTGNIFVAGQTSSSNFPVANAVQGPPAVTDNCFNGFVTKLNPAAPSYVFSTYLRGTQCDVAHSVDVDGSGNVYVTGMTTSTDFLIANAFQPTLSGSFNSDAFVTKLTSTGALTYSTFLGGSNGSDTGFAIAADSAGNAYITGFTTSSNFPLMNPFQATIGNAQFGSQQDVFITKLNAQGSALIFSTYLGGSGFETGRGIALDAANNAYVTGNSDSHDFPLVAGALRTKSPMYKSLDGSANWSNDNYGFTGGSTTFAGSTVTGLAIHPTQPSTLYAGTGNGVFKTTNGGRTWTAINNGLTNRNVVALVIDPLTPSTLYVATAGVVIDTCVYKSIDGGSNWNLRSNGITAPNLVTLAIDPVTPNTLYTVFSFGGPGSHLYKTTDGADNWNLVGNTPPSIPAVVIDPLNHLTLYAADLVSGGGVYKSIDAGTTWQSLGLTGRTARSVSVSPFTAGLVFAGTEQGLFRSTDSGANWSLIPSVSGKVVFDPVSSSTAYLLSAAFFPNQSFFQNPQGIFKSTDAGQTWIAMNKGLNTPLALALVIDPQKPSTLHLASTPSAGQDAFVTKINQNGSALIYSTFIGGPLDSQNFSNTSAQGNAIALDGVGNAYIAGLAATQSFPVTPNSYQPFNRGSNDAFVVKLGMSYIISGRVLNNGAPGSPLSGAEVILNDGTSLTSVTTESDGSYQFSRLREGGNYTVSAAKPHFTMTPASQTFNNLNSDKVQDFSALTSDSPFFTISGKITENGVGLAGITVTLSGSQAGLRTTDSNGNYSFELIVGGNYTITPSVSGFTFIQASQTFNSLSANQTANFTANRQNFVVTNTNNHGSGSLRDAIINANATLGTDKIVFNIPGAGVKVISLVISLPEITDRVVIDGTTQPGYAGTPLIELDGLTTGSNSHGLIIKAGGSTVRGLSIGNFRNGNAIWLNASDNNVIQSNYLGVAANGTTTRQNSRGVALTNSSNNLIGGTTAAARNVISGNGQGIDITGDGNTIQGNFIGTNAAGTAAIPQGSGISIFNADSENNLIGGTVAGAGNLISGNQFGVQTNGTGTTIQGNLIGTDVTGTNRVPNTNGLQAIGTNMLIGGLVPGARNIVSGNSNDGVYCRGAGSKVQGNYIGTDITGTLALGNNGNGVVAGENALIGGTVPAARNIISANASFGNVVLGFNNSGSAGTVQGNYIGTDVTGTRALGGLVPGVNVISNNNVIGGTVAGARNVISGNSVGVQLGGFFNGPIGNVVQGNFIGVNAAGTGELRNAHQGIVIADAVNNTVGGTQSGAGNTIAFNGASGISITVGTGNAIRGNSIFSNNGLGIDLNANGVTANDSNDGDTGANHLQNFPVLTSLVSTSNSTTIQGSLKSIPNTTFNIDFFSNAAVDPSGNGEGAQFFNTTSVNTNANGDATINVTFPAGLPAGRVITATATDPNGNTSEFSAADSAGAIGSVQFSVSSIQVIEDIGTLTVNVLRTGGSSGTLTANYSTANGTAIAGQDYTSASGTVTFNGGETSKTIQIPILDDATTEPDETFTVTLSTSNLESLGAPSNLTVTLQDRTTVPTLSVSSASVVEGNAGATTEMLFTVNLSAATGRTVSANYATAPLTASGGATCSTQGADYETTNGILTFQPGSTTFTFAVKVCGDTSAEANEVLRIVVSTGSGGTLITAQGIGIIFNDDVLELLLEESGPTANSATALDALLGLRDPFRVLLGIPEWFAVNTDRNTRVVLFARNLQLNPGEFPSAVIVRLTDGFGQIFEVAAEDVRPIANTEFTQVKIRLPSNLAAGTCTVFIRAHTLVSNTGTIRIAP